MGKSTDKFASLQDIQRIHGPGYYDIHNNRFSALANPKFGLHHHLTDGIIKDVTFHIASTGETIKENIVITDKEEIITTSRATFIFDYSNGWLVTKVSDRGTNACYISEFKMTGSIEDERESLKKIKGDVTVNNDDVIKTQYKRTNRVVDASTLSPTAASMCEQSRLVWFTGVKNRRARGSEPPAYGYQYQVGDDNYGTDFNAQEERDGESISGSYQVLLPDGRTQIVTYNVHDYDNSLPTIPHEVE